MEISKIPFTCKVCSKEYKIAQDDVLRVPIWNLEVCSKKCSMICSSKRFLNHTKCALPRVILPSE